MECKIFYSWQSDLPNSTNRGFIEKALENAIKSIRNDDSISLEPVIERDTSGELGSPDIAKTILARIDTAQIFVCDVSITNNNDTGRKTPNPNVLYELGYAQKAIGYERIINIFNTAFGKVEDLPFDIRMRRAVTYLLGEDNQDKQTERKKLESLLVDNIKAILQKFEIQSITNQESDILSEAIKSVSQRTVFRQKNLDRYMTWFISKIEAVSPVFDENQELDEKFLESINNSQDYVLSFCKLTELLCDIDDTEDIIYILHGLEKILEHYSISQNYSGTFFDYYFDYYKFIGHEIFVCLNSFLLRREKWEILEEILGEKYYVSNSPSKHDGYVDFSYFSQYVSLLENRNIRLNLRKTSLHGDVLVHRYSDTPLSQLVPNEIFIDTDVFLFFMSDGSWIPWTCMYLEGRIPKFLAKATKITYAESLMKILKISSTDLFRSQLRENRNRMRSLFIRKNIFFDPLEYLEIEKIGSI